ncbi:MAG: CBS domain-containing protein [Micromonosporaceae bacterium]
MTSAVKDVMTRNVVAVRETARYKTIVTAMRSGRMSAFPVLDAAEHVVGVVSEADLLLKEVGLEPFTGPRKSVLATGRRGERAKAAGVTAAELMSKPAVTIGPDASVAEAARLMYERRVKRLPVVDSTGRLAGIVSRVDVLSVFTRPDGQIRGDVIKNVIAGEFALNPNAFVVTVTSGIVTIAGEVERRAIAPHLIHAVRHVEGVVDVRDRLSYPHDPPRPGRHFRWRNHSLARRAEPHTHANSIRHL